MDIKEAFEILELSFGSNKEEIDKQFKKLSFLVHPDHGGTNEQFIEISKAKELALIYSENKALIALTNHFVNQEIAIILRKNEINEEVKFLINKKDRRIRSKYQSYKDWTLVFALITGGMTFISNKIPNINNSLLNQYLNEAFIDRILIMFGVVFGIAFLFLNFLTNRLKDRIEELKELFENKEEMYEILFDIFDEKTESELSRNEINELIKERFFTIHKSSFRFKKLLFPIFERNGQLERFLSDILFLNSTSVEGLVRFIGYRDFGKILLLKGVSNKLIEEIEFKENQEYSLKFKLKRINDYHQHSIYEKGDVRN